MGIYLSLYINIYFSCGKHRGARQWQKPKWNDKSSSGWEEANEPGKEGESNGKSKEEEQDKLKTHLLKETSPYLGCLASDELDLEGEGKEEKKERKKTSHITHGKKEGFPLFATI